MCLAKLVCIPLTTFISKTGLKMKEPLPIFSEENKYIRRFIIVVTVDASVNVVSRIRAGMFSSCLRSNLKI
jgi:hypothetical protein